MLDDPQGYELVDVEVEFLAETPLAILVSDGDTEVWLPKSQIEYDDEEMPRGQLITVGIPLYMAEDKGLV